MKKLLAFLLVYPAAALVALRLGAVVAEQSTVAAFFFTVHPVVVVATLAAGFSLASYLMGAVSGDYSWVDRLWSTAPVAFAWVYAVRSELAPAPTVAALLVTLWGVRLSYNFARRGGYTTLEDYRWPILRKRIKNPILWQLFNLLFISGYQIGLFILFTLPIYQLSRLAGSVPLGATIVCAALFLLFLCYETIADQQQWEFQAIKHGESPSADAPSWMAADDVSAEAALEEDLERGFLTHGLFRYSRHPNYFGELGVWWTLYLYVVLAGGELFHWSGIGAVLLTLLFMGSTALTESISAARYTRYEGYRGRTSAIVPWVPGMPAEQEPVDQRTS